jgi:drug/metabolite transporter (DMT)-like permease
MAASLAQRENERGVLAGHAALAFVQLCFGLMPIFGKWAFQPGGFAPLSIVAWRIFTGALVLSALALARHRRALLLPPRDMARVLLLALLGIVLNQALYIEGLARTTAMQAGLFTCLIPVFTFVVATCLGQERFAPGRAVGVLVALAGAAPLFVARGAQLELSRGALYLAGCALVYSFYLVLSKPMLARHSPLVVLAWVYVGSLPGAAIFAWHARLMPAEPSSSGAWLALGLILLFPTLIAYLLNLFALARVRASTTAIYIYAQPLITASASALLLDERPTPGMLRAAALLFLGIWLVARAPGHKKDLPRAALPRA